MQAHCAPRPIRVNHITKLLLSQVGANWVHFSNMKEDAVNPIELMVKDAGLNYVVDDYNDVIFRYKGSHFVNKQVQMWCNFKGEQTYDQQKFDLIIIESQPD